MQYGSSAGFFDAQDEVDQRRLTPATSTIDGQEVSLVESKSQSIVQSQESVFAFVVLEESFDVEQQIRQSEPSRTLVLVLE